MDPSQDSMSAWLQRAEQFVRGLSRLPGQWGVSIAVEPPVERAAFDEVTREFSYELPPPLRRLYVEGAARFKCSYNWSPDARHRLLAQEVFPHQMSFGGGPEFVPFSELSRTVGVFWGWDEDNELTAEQRSAARIWEQTVPFIHVGNGDVVGLDVAYGSDPMPVVYLVHDDPENSVRVLAESLDRFLADWERLSYVGPEIWLLDPFLGEDGKGPLSIDEEKAAKWRKLLLGGE